MTARMLCMLGILIFAVQPAFAQVKPSPKKKPAQKSAPKPAELNLSPVTPAAGEIIPGEPLRFNTESPAVSTDPREPLKFTDPGETPLDKGRPEYVEMLQQESPYKTFPGYPKHQAGIFVQPMTMASQWTYNNQEFNFRSSSTALGVNYRLMITPMWSMEVTYDHYAVALSGDIAGGFIFESSTTQLDEYYYRTQYCMFGKASFYRQLCPGIDIGNDAYPILNFISGTRLRMSKVQDFVAGGHLTYQEPITSRWVFRGTINYLRGTGIGQSGPLTSKNNSSYAFDAVVEWSATDHHLMTVAFNYRARSAKIRGVIGNNQDTWNTNSAQVGGRLGYMYTF